MGRGRAKAKQTKVARDLKYRTHETDFGALARELHGENDSDTGAEESVYIFSSVGKFIGVAAVEPCGRTEAEITSAGCTGFGSCDLPTVKL